MTLSGFAVQVVSVRLPGNWDRPLGYSGTARFVSVYWDSAVDDVFIFDGRSGKFGGAWWLFTNLVEYDARQQIAAALMACGVPGPLTNNYPLGNSETSATHGLIINRFEHTCWVAQLESISRFLPCQHLPKLEDFRTLTVSLAREKRAILEEQIIVPSMPCHCARGWILKSDYYIPCPECSPSCKIEEIPDKITL
jgi:hypothetical protein